jgi:hypothetical protein
MSVADMQKTPRSGADGGRLHRQLDGTVGDCEGTSRLGAMIDNRHIR